MRRRDSPTCAGRWVSPDCGVWSGYLCRCDLFGSMLLSGIVINNGRVSLASPSSAGTRITGRDGDAAFSAGSPSDRVRAAISYGNHRRIEIGVHISGEASLATKGRSRLECRSAANFPAISVSSWCRAGSAPPVRSIAATGLALSHVLAVDDLAISYRQVT